MPPRRSTTTNFANTYISYYTWGTAIGVGLDLVAARSLGRKGDARRFMRALWRRFGRPGIDVPGYVKTPYTIDDLKDVLGTVAGDAEFAKTSSLATSKGTRFPTTRGSSGGQAF